MAIEAGYVPSADEKDIGKLARAVRNLFENGAPSGLEARVETLEAGLKGAFRVELSGDQTGATGGAQNRINFNSEILDADGWFDSATNYRYTPLSAGYYFFALCVQASATASDVPQAIIKKNNAAFATAPYFPEAVDATQLTGTFMFSLNSANGSTDYFDFFVYLPSGITTIKATSSQTFAVGFKIAEL